MLAVQSTRVPPITICTLPAAADGNGSITVGRNCVALRLLGFVLLTHRVYRPHDNAVSQTAILPAMRQTLALLLLTTLLTACRLPMVMPAMFEAGAVNPLADVPENQQTNRQTLFYVTDRRFIYEDDRLIYTRQRADTLSAGQAVIAFGPDDAWQAISAATRAQPGGKRFKPQLAELMRYGSLQLTPPGPDEPIKAEENRSPKVGEQFVNDLNAAMRDNGSDQITIYTHGYNISFHNAAFTAAEYDLYTGGLGPFILYAWPSYDSLFEYSHDRDSVRYTTAHARRFFAFLADEITAGRLKASKINVIAHSTGAEAIGTVLRELALMSMNQSPEERRARWHIGKVLLVAPDISTDVARERLLKEDIRGVYDQMVVYSSINDRALRWASSVLYRTSRIGAIHELSLTDTDRYWISRAKDIAVVDVDSSPYAGVVNHSHHRFSPGVVSDIILSLRTDLTPTERGLVRDEDNVIWRFADDYKQRVTEAAVRAYGEAPAP